MQLQLQCFTAGRLVRRSTVVPCWQLAEQYSSTAACLLPQLLHCSDLSIGRPSTSSAHGSSRMSQAGTASTLHHLQLLSQLHIRSFT